MSLMLYCPLHELERQQLVRQTGIQIPQPPQGSNNASLPQEKTLTELLTPADGQQSRAGGHYIRQAFNHFQN